jgi:hypothetical protein
MLHTEEKQYYRDLMYIEKEKDIMYMRDWADWQREAKKEQKEAKIVVKREIKEHDRIKTNV